MSRLISPPMPFSGWYIVPTVGTLPEVAGRYEREESEEILAGDCLRNALQSSWIQESESFKAKRSLYRAWLEYGG